MATEWQRPPMEIIERIEAGQMSWLDAVRHSRPPDPGQWEFLTHRERRGLRIHWETVIRRGDDSMIIDTGEARTRRGAKRQMEQVWERFASGTRPRGAGDGQEFP